MVDETESGSVDTQDRIRWAAFADPDPVLRTYGRGEQICLDQGWDPALEMKLIVEGGLFTIEVSERLFRASLKA